MSLANIKIMVCDDSILSRKRLKDTIMSLGCKTVYEAIDGEQAVEIYRQYKPAIVLMDIVMPKKDGLQALTEILEIDANAKIVMASSVGTQSHLKKAIEAGAKNFLQKPVDKEHLSKILLSLLEGGE